MRSGTVAVGCHWLPVGFFEPLPQSEFIVSPRLRSEFANGHT